jgi:hypothetical protein
VSKETWTPEEDATLTRQHAISGNHWTVIAAQLPRRSPMQIKNRWNWIMRHQNRTARLQIPTNGEAGPDVIERNHSQVVFAPLALDNGLFGTAFQEFQAKMFML